MYANYQFRSKTPTLKCGERWHRSNFLPSQTLALDMAKHSSVAMALFRKRWLTVVALLVMLSVTTAIAFIVRASLESSCDCRVDVASAKRYNSSPESAKPIGVAVTQSPLSFMKSRLVLLVSHELSLSGTFYFFFWFPWISLLITIYHLLCLVRFVNVAYGAF